MQKNNWIQMVLAVMLAIMAVGCGASKDEVSTIQQESAAETDSEKEDVRIESINDINIEETQTVTETETLTETDTGQNPTPETHLQTETQEETESQETGDGSEIGETEIQSVISDPQTEIKSNTETQQPATEGSVSALDYMVSVRGTAVVLQEDMRDFVSTLGEPDGYSAAKSCVEAGEDKIYVYGGITIYTYVTDGADRITLIEITGSESLPSGIHIGSTKADVIAAYGSAFTDRKSVV